MDDTKYFEAMSILGSPRRFIYQCFIMLPTVVMVQAGLWILYRSSSPICWG